MVAPSHDVATHVVAQTFGEGPCRLSVVTTPAGASIKLDGRDAGISPLEIRSPCTKRRVDIVHAQYVGQTRWAMLATEAPQSIDVILARPIYMVLVRSYPSGAKVSINDRFAGFAPTYVRVPAFTPVDLEVSKVGFRAATKRITIESLPQQPIIVRLAR